MAEMILTEMIVLTEYFEYLFLVSNRVPRWLCCVFKSNVHYFTLFLHCRLTMMMLVFILYSIQFSEIIFSRFWHSNIINKKTEVVVLNIHNAHCIYGIIIIIKQHKSDEKSEMRVQIRNGISSFHFKEMINCLILGFNVGCAAGAVWKILWFYY